MDSVEFVFCSFNEWVWFKICFNDELGEFIEEVVDAIWGGEDDADVIVEVEDEGENDDKAGFVERDTEEDDNVDVEGWDVKEEGEDV